MNIKQAILDFIAKYGFAPTIVQVARMIGRPRNRTREMVVKMVEAGELATERGRVWVR